MLPKRPSRLLVELLEDRLTPSASYFYDGSNLTITGQTTNATFTLTETANNTLTTQDGANPAKMWANVTGRLSVTLQEIGATGLAVNYTFAAGTRANGPVTINASAFTPGSTTAVNVTGTGSTIGGPLTVSVMNGNADTVNVQGLTVGGGVYVTDTLGNATVNIGTTAATTVNGHLTVTNANTVNLGGAGGVGVAGGGTATVQGIASITTRSITGVADSLNVAAGSTVQGSLIFTGNGASATTENLAGSVFGSVITQLGTGANAINFAATSMVFGSTTLVGGSGGTATTAAAGSLFAGGFNATMGNGTNTLTFNGTDLGPSFGYYGGNGTDTVTYAAAAGAPRLNVNLGAGDDTFTLGSNAYSGGVVNGGFGLNTFMATVAISPPLSILNFL